jgi:RimJ/RimL family protein N-acetyltransferase
VSAEPDLLVSGERVALGPLRPDLAEIYGRWMNQPEVRFGVEYLAIATPQSQQAWIEESNKAAAKREPEAVAFTIYDLTDGTPVGTCSLFEISYMQSSARFGISLGERRGQGLGGEATRLTLDWAFHVLGLHNVLLEALAWNAAAIRAYERAGFRRIGTRREAAMSRGERADVVLMDALRADFGESVLAPSDATNVA